MVLKYSTRLPSFHYFTVTDPLLSLIPGKVGCSMVIDLNGLWEMRRCTDTRWYPAQVPGCVHTDLQHCGLIADPFFESNELRLEWIEHTDFEYRTSFTVSSELLARRHLELIAEGLDTLAAIYLNGSLVATTENMFMGYRFAVKPYLVCGNNTITVRFGNPMEYIRKRKGYPWSQQPNDPVGGASGIRKMQCSFGWDWGPRLPTCGIFRSIYIEARSGPRIAHVAISQVHSPRQVRLHFRPELDGGKKRGISWRSRISLEGVPVAESESLSLSISSPRLWWPHGSGPQPLHTVTVELVDNGTVLATWTKRIGLRTIALDRRKDRWGESFRFLVNGKPVYAKGANWIPAHILPSSVDHATYRSLLQSAVEANFNMLRVWGGGLYEHEDFYNLCDEYGIMVWHDFMFACSLYPQDEPFMQSVADEARYQTRRLARHACMALWCGNNELEHNVAAITETPEKKKAYDRIFYDILPKAVKKNAPHTSYWPSSPHNPEGYVQGPNNEFAGDAHYWDVWHAGLQPEAAHKHHFRFWSEFGMQAYCSVDTALQFTSADKLNVFGPAMENHQKHPVGNALIFQYIAYRYRFPNDFAALVYLSQVNQAFCIATMVEHQRSGMPRTMGSLYWQLNDCWPVFSWSGIDFGGQWKALHYAARRFYAPALVSFKLIGEETTGRINRRINTVTGVQLITVYDGPTNCRAKLRWDLFTVDTGRVVLHGEKTVLLKTNEAVVRKVVNLGRFFRRFGKDNLVMRLSLVQDDRVLSENTVLFTAPRFIELPKEKLVPSVKKVAAASYALLFKSKTFQHQVSFHLKGTRYRATDNFFDLFPGIVHTVSVTVEGEKHPGVAWVKRRLEVMSVAESY
jgi:beta-mannosidase